VAEKKAAREARENLTVRSDQEKERNRLERLAIEAERLALRQRGVGPRRPPAAAPPGPRRPPGPPPAPPSTPFMGSYPRDGLDDGKHEDAGSSPSYPALPSRAAPGEPMDVEADGEPPGEELGEEGGAEDNADKEADKAADAAEAAGFNYEEAGFNYEEERDLLDEALDRDAEKKRVAIAKQAEKDRLAAMKVRELEAAFWDQRTST
jgi:hypothetical protein